MNFKFRLLDLLNTTVYFAVTAWLVSIKAPMLVPIWLGSVFGWEAGRRSDYPAILVMLCGSVSGLAFVVTWWLGATSIFAPGASIFPFGNNTQLWLTLASFLVFLFCFLWICYRIKRSPKQEKRTGDIQKPAAK